MITIRKHQDRGHAQHGWLDSFHMFSFADYYDPAHMGFRALRVINEDRVAPRKGFSSHSHRDMEILTYVLEGALEHKDSMGNGSVIRPGDVQRMSAGTGVVHSEFNPSLSDPVHFLQIWILPAEEGLEPSYEQKTFADAEKFGKLRVIASHDGREGSVVVHQDADLYAAILGPGGAVRHPLKGDRRAWLQVARGSTTLNGYPLEAGDGVAVSGEAALEIGGGSSEAEVLLFDLA
jgi:redox-sensitive bicupin YhaK (pirin superfamily)